MVNEVITDSSAYDQPTFASTIVRKPYFGFRTAHTNLTVCTVLSRGVELDATHSERVAISDMVAVLEEGFTEDVTGALQERAKVTRVSESEHSQGHSMSMVSEILYTEDVDGDFGEEGARVLEKVCGVVHEVNSHYEAIAAIEDGDKEREDIEEPREGRTVVSNVLQVRAQNRKREIRILTDVQEEGHSQGREEHSFIVETSTVGETYFFNRANDQKEKVQLQEWEKG